ncbi:MAG: 4Fe-4S binding protein [Planctomycetota bacterium]|nr:MAG: 4Fe-4S binding protein [Planctomycetota bacterium]
MYPLAAISFKFLQEPLIPVAGTVDLAPFLIMIGLLSVGGILVRMGWIRQRQWLRRGTQVAATLAFVIGLHPCACMVRDLLQGALKINYDNVRAFQLMMLIVPLATFTIIWGRVFCGWVCPIGFIQEVATKSTNWMRFSPHQKVMRQIRFILAAVLLLGTVVIYTYIRPANEPILQGMAAGYLIVLAILIILGVADKRWELRLRNVRYAALSFFVVSTVLGIYLHAAFCVLFTNDWRRSPVMLLAGVLFASLILSQAWCRFLCPEGALLGLLTRLSGLKIRLNRSKCTACNTCNKACPVEAIEVGQVDERSCLYCCRCVDSCPTKAIDMTDEELVSESLSELPVMPSTDN